VLAGLRLPVDGVWVPSEANILEWVDEKALNVVYNIEFLSKGVGAWKAL
jgi:hypothetical protein